MKANEKYLAIIKSCNICVLQEVKLAVYNGEIEVAVKTMKEGSMSEVDFIDEAKIMM